MPGHLPPTNDDRVIWDMWESQFRLPACTVADELGIFRALSDAALTTDQLAGGLGLDAHALGMPAEAGNYVERAAMRLAVAESARLTLPGRIE